MFTPENDTELRKPYILRDEPFGYTLYDRRTLRHEFVLKEEWNQIKVAKGITEEDFAYRPAKRTDFRQDIVYSPIRIYWETTLACNLHCIYCFNDSGKKRPFELCTEEMMQAMDGLKEANVLDLRFTGGELTRRDDWFDVLKRAKELGFSVSCNTNGIYSDPEVPDKFAQLRIEQVTISIDGRKENHEKHRGKNTFDRTLRSLERMQELGVRLRINTLIRKSSLDDLDYMADLAADHGVEEINFFITRFVGRGQDLQSEAASFEEFYEMSQRADQARDRHPRLRILHFEEATIRNSSRGGEYDKFGLRVGPPDGSTRFNIIHNGDIYAGGYMPYVDQGYRAGNVRTDNIYEVWQSNPILEKFRDQSRRLENFCANCKEFKKRCPGPNFELERLRQIRPDLENPYCFYGDGPSLLTLIERGRDRP